MPRKYAFHLFLSSHLFLKCGLREHAKRNYETSLSIYGELGWTLISDHLNFALGKQAIQRAEFSLAVDYFIKLLRKSRQSATAHRAYLAEFLYLFQQFAGIADAANVSQKMSCLPIPELFDKTVVIASKDPVSLSTARSQGGGGTIGANDTEENAIWETLEASLMKESPKFASSVGTGEKIDVFESAVGGNPYNFKSPTFSKSSYNRIRLYRL